MRTVAFKRAKQTPHALESLHPEFITEYAYTDLFELGFHKAEDGYEILEEDQFQEELSKNDSLHEAFVDDKRKREQDRIAASVAEQILKDKQEKIANREFEEFLRWKANKSKK